MEWRITTGSAGRPCARSVLTSTRAPPRRRVSRDDGDVTRLKRQLALWPPRSGPARAAATQSAWRCPTPRARRPGRHRTGRRPLPSLRHRPPRRAGGGHTSKPTCAASALAPPPPGRASRRRRCCCLGLAPAARSEPPRPRAEARPERGTPRYGQRGRRDGERPAARRGQGRASAPRLGAAAGRGVCGRVEEAPNRKAGPGPARPDQTGRPTRVVHPARRDEGQGWGVGDSERTRPSARPHIHCELCSREIGASDLHMQIGTDSDPGSDADWETDWDDDSDTGWDAEADTDSDTDSDTYSDTDWPDWVLTRILTGY